MIKTGQWKETKAEIERIGKKVVACGCSCKGINNNPSRGILPRCLFFEEAANPEGKSCVVIGINPGKSDVKEREYFLRHGCSYSATVDYWNGNVKDMGYYGFLRDFLAQLGFRGPILWTELVKCENASRSRKRPPEQTFRKCARLFLRKELDAVNKSWPVFAIGREVYKAAVYMIIDRPVIGVPHPNSRGWFHNLFTGKDKTRRLRRPVIRSVDETLASPQRIARWLTAKKPR